MSGGNFLSSMFGTTAPAAATSPPLAAADPEVAAPKQEVQAPEIQNPEEAAKDVKLDYMLSNYKNAAPPKESDDLGDKMAKELKTRWWLWGLVAFLLFVGTGMYVYGPQILSSAKRDAGMPVLAVRQEGNAKCDAMCQDASAVRDVVCYTKCMDDFRKDVKEEHDATVEVSKDAAAEEAEATAGLTPADDMDAM